MFQLCSITVYNSVLFFCFSASRLYWMVHILAFGEIFSIYVSGGFIFFNLRWEDVNMLNLKSVDYSSAKFSNANYSAVCV